MPRIESTLVVHRSPEEVFRFLNMRESHLRFIPRMISLEQTSPGKFGQAGTRLSGMLNYFGIRIPVEYKIIEVEPEKKLTMNGKMGTILFKDGYVLKRIDAGTEIKFWLDLLPGGWAKVLTPFTGVIGKVHAWETLRNLERELAKQEITTSSPS